MWVRARCSKKVSRGGHGHEPTVRRCGFRRDVIRHPHLKKSGSRSRRLSAHRLDFQEDRARRDGRTSRMERGTGARDPQPDSLRMRMREWGPPRRADLPAHSERRVEVIPAPANHCRRPSCRKEPSLIGCECRLRFSGQIGRGCRGRSPLYPRKAMTSGIGHGWQAGFPLGRRPRTPKGESLLHGIPRAFFSWYRRGVGLWSKYVRCHPIA